MFIMVFTIHRYIFRDLLKTFILATVILSTVLGLGVMLRPLREFSVDPANVPTLILCTLPITLTMVIPIAALLSATVNYGRLAVDNEISACRSSGINLLTLIYPALALALLVGMATLLLAFHVIPSFTSKFERIIKTDAEAIIFRNIQKKGNLGNLAKGIFIHADYAIPEEHRLIGVAVIRRGRDKEIDYTITAEQIVLDFSEMEKKKQILLYCYNVYAIGKDFTGEIEEPLIISVKIPSMFRDNIKFKKLAQLQAIEDDMTLFEPIRNIQTEIRQQLMVEAFFAWCNQQLSRPSECIELRKGPDLIRIYAQNCKMKTPSKKPDQKTPDKNRTAYLTGKDDSGIKAIYYYATQQDTVAKHYQASQGRLTVTPLGKRPSVVLKLQEVEWNYPQSTNKYHLGRYDIANINLPDDIIVDAKLVSLDEMLSETYNLTNDNSSAYLQHLEKVFKRETDELRVEIKMELHSRLAFGVSCVVLVLLGAALGMIFRSGHLLTAFGISFIPTALCLITIFTGKHIAEQDGASTTAGIIFLWSGIAIAAVANAIIYRRLLKR